jgi:hypothetical protein
MAAFFNAHLAPAFGAMQALGLNTRMSIVTLPEELMPQQRICHRDARESHPGEGAAASVLYLFEDAHGRHQLLPAAPASGNRPPAAPRHMETTPSAA